MNSVFIFFCSIVLKEILIKLKLFSLMFKFGVDVFLVDILGFKSDIVRFLVEIFRVVFMCDIV